MVSARVFDLCKLRGHVPILKGTGDDEFIGTLHVAVNLRIDKFERCFQRRGPGIEPADVPGIKLENELLVFGRFEIAFGLILLHLLHHVRRKFVAQLVDVLHIAGNAGHHVGDDDALQVLRDI